MIQNLGLIPARGGSKKIPRKNIAILGGKPLIHYTVEAAQASKLLSKIIVSTDDIEIKRIAMELGVDVPFLRPTNISADKTSDQEVIEHVVQWYRRNNIQIENIVYLRPTTPFKTGRLIDECIDKFRSSHYTGLRTVTKVEGVSHPYWMFKIENGTLRPIIENIRLDRYYQRQLLPDCYRLNGLVDIIKSEEIRKSDLYGDRIGYFETEDRQSIDIDTEFDLDYCEYLITRDCK